MLTVNSQTRIILESLNAPFCAASCWWNKELHLICRSLRTRTSRTVQGLDISSSLPPHHPPCVCPYSECSRVCVSVQVRVAQFSAASMGHVTRAGVNRWSLIVLVTILLQRHRSGVSLGGVCVQCSQYTALTLCLRTTCCTLLSVSRTPPTHTHAVRSQISLSVCFTECKT